jgi:hypothetical protein
MVKLIGLRVFRYVAPQKPDLPHFDAGIRLIERYLPSPDALDLTANEGKTAFQGVKHQIIVLGLAVLAHNSFVVVLFVDGFLARFRCRSRFPCSFSPGVG